MRWWLLALVACADSGGKLELAGTDDTGGPAAPDDTDPAGGTGTPTPPDPGDGPPNVLIVLIDDVGLDKVRSYFPQVDGLPPQPTLDRLAAEGMRFENAYAQPVCSPTRAVLLTGRHARRYGIGRYIPPGSSIQLPLPEVTLPEMLALADLPWATAMIGKWHLANASAPSGIEHAREQGYNHFSGVTGNFSPDPDDYFHWTRIVNGVKGDVDGYATTVNVDDTLAWIADAPEPWLVNLSFNAAHSPWHRPPDALHSQDAGSPPDDVSRYHAAVEAVDTELGRLLDTLDPDVLAHTMVFVLGDNGTPGAMIVPPFTPGRGKGKVAELGVRVPFLVTGPLVARQGSVSDALVHIADLFPTVAELAGIDLDAHPLKPRDGHSLVPLLADPDRASEHTYLYADHFKQLGPPPYTDDDRTLRDDRWKLIRLRENDGDGVQWHFFDLAGFVYDEGDPLPLDALDAEEEAAYARLRTEITRIDDEVVFDPEYEKLYD